jgi:hypothetical protein
MLCFKRIRLVAWALRSASCAAARGGRDRQLVLAPGRPRREDRAGGLRARALVAGFGQRDDAGHEGQQFDQAALADLGQVVNGARATLPAEQQPSVSVGEDQRPGRW